MRVCLLCFPPNHSVSIAPHQSKQTCEFACLASRPTIAFCTALYQSRQTHTLLPAQASRLASRYTKAGKLASLPAFLPTQPYRWHRAIPKQANLRLLCSRPTIASCTALYQSKQTCKFACSPSRPTIASCIPLYQSRQPCEFACLPSHPTIPSGNALHQSRQPCEFSLWHCAIPTQAGSRVCLLCFPPNHSVLHRAIPKQANLRVCLHCFPPNHSVLRRVIPKQANLRVCLLCSRPTIASCVALYQSRQTCEFACFAPAQP